MESGLNSATQVKSCPDGEIGRRTVFRWQRPQACRFESCSGHREQNPEYNLGVFYFKRVLFVLEYYIHIVYGNYN